MTDETFLSALAAHGEHIPRSTLAAEIARGSPGRTRLLRLSTHGKPSIRRWIVEGLAAFRTPAVHAALRAALRDPAMTVRLHALNGIVAYRQQALYDDLPPLFSDPSGGIRLNLLAGLESISHPALAGLLLIARADPKAYIRAWVQRRIGPMAG